MRITDRDTGGHCWFLLQAARTSRNTSSERRYAACSRRHQPPSTECSSLSQTWHIHWKYITQTRLTDKPTNTGISYIIFFHCTTCNISSQTRRALCRAHLVTSDKGLPDGSVNKTILKPRLALAACRQYIYVRFSWRKIPHSSPAHWEPRQGCKVP